LLYPLAILGRSHGSLGAAEGNGIGRFSQVRFRSCRSSPAATRPARAKNSGPH